MPIREVQEWGQFRSKLDKEERDGRGGVLILDVFVDAINE